VGYELWGECEIKYQQRLCNFLLLCGKRSYGMFVELLALIGLSMTVFMPQTLSAAILKAQRAARYLLKAER